MDEITIGDKTYISSKLAAKITGYAKDYVGQLCREGRVEARLVGRNWYVLEASIREHRFGKEETQEVSAKNSENSEEDLPELGWGTPVYKPEVPRLVPELTPKITSSIQGAPAIAEMQSAWREWFETRPNGTTVSVQEYQEQRIEVTSDAQEVAETTADESHESYQSHFAEAIPAFEEVTVPVARIREPEPVAAPINRPATPIDIVPVQRPNASFTGLDRSVKNSSEQQVNVVSPSRRVGRKEQKSQGGVGPLQILLLVLAGVSLIVALIGTGNADRFFGGTSIDFGAQKSLIQFLEGTSTYESSL